MVADVPKIRFKGFSDDWELVKGDKTGDAFFF